MMGAFDLEGLFVRLGSLIDDVKAKRAKHVAIRHRACGHPTRGGKDGRLGQPGICARRGQHVFFPELDRAQCRPNIVRTHSLFLVNLLYAEDDDNDVFLLKRVLPKVGLEAPRVVPNGQEAVAYLDGKKQFADRAQHPLPDMALLDINMPFMSGLEVLAWARPQPRFAALPIVMFTSSSQEKDIATAYAAGATAYVLKPSSIHVFMEFAKFLRGLDLSAPLAPQDFREAPGFQPPKQ